MIHKLLIIPLLFLSVIVSAQITHTSGVPHRNDNPTELPTTKGSRIQFNMQGDSIAFFRNSDSTWVIYHVNNIGAEGSSVVINNGNFTHEIGAASTGTTLLRAKKNQWEVANRSAISSLTLAAGDRVIVSSSGAEYLVETDSVSGYAVDSIAVIEVGSVYAVIQPTDGGYQVNHFGAIPDDGLADDVAIQKAVNFVLTTNTKVKSHSVICAAGVYTINTGIVVSRRDGADYTFATIEIKGQGNAYAAGIGRATVWDCNNNDGFGLHLFRVRNSVVSGISFAGNIIDVTNQDSIFFGTSAYYAQAGIRTNRYSPYAAIVVDGFWNTSDADAYPDFTSYYSLSSNGGSSNVVIEGCAINGFIVGVAHSISKTVQNGDNMKLRDSYIASCQTAFATGQDQTRGNSIQNIYSLFCQVFVNSESYGVGIGSLPSVDNVNIAGACRQIISNNSSERSQNSFSNIFAESIYSIGESNSPTINFTGCRFTLTAEKPSPLMVFKGNDINGAVFTGCYIGNYGSPNRVMVFSKKTSFYNCTFEGFPTGRYTNSPSEELNTLLYYDCRLLGVNSSIATLNNVAKVYDNIPESNFNSQMGVPCKGIEIGTQTFKVKATGALYNRFSESNRPLVYNSGNPYYISAAPGINQAGDALMLFDAATDTAINVLSSGYVMVSRVSGDTVFIEPNSYSRWFAKSDYNIWPVTFYFNRPFLPVACETTAGNTFMITKDKGPLAFTGSASVIGARIYGPGITNGTYVTRGNGDTIFISRAVQADRSYAYYKFFNHVKETKEDNSNFVFDLGDRYIVQSEGVYEEYFCSTIGRQTGFQSPVFRKIYPTSQNNTGQVSGSTDGSGDIVVSTTMPDATFSVNVVVAGTTPYIITAHTKTTSGFTLRVFDAAGVAVTSTAVTIDWEATDY